jgi:hypothetical protein
MKARLTLPIAKSSGMVELGERTRDPNILLPRPLFYEPRIFMPREKLR